MQWNALRVIARRVLGRKGVFLLRNLLSESMYRLGFLKPATELNRAECISAMVLTYNDPDWLEPSLLSVKRLVDEYVIVDSSTDETTDILSLIHI